MAIFYHLQDVIAKKGGCYIVLIDPDRKNDHTIENQIKLANDSDVDAIFVGGSLMMDAKCAQRVKKIKVLSNIPVIFFPGGVGQLNPHYDAILFMSVLSGRNPHYLIGEQVIAAPLIKDMGIETISTGYILLDGGAGSTVEFMSGSRPIPMHRRDVVIAHALAGQYLGMNLIYLEAGSGANQPVSSTIIKAVHDAIDIPIIVGGGIQSPETASIAVKAGASIIVTGTAIEKDSNIMKDFADAIHWKN